MFCRGDVRVVDTDGWQAIHDAAFNGHIKTVAELIQLGADVNCIDKTGHTPLWAASRQGHDQVVNILLDNKAQVDHNNSMGVTALFIASQKGHLVTAKTLIEYGADVNAAAFSGDTPLIVASQNGKNEIVKLLLENQAVVDHKNSEGVTALLMASHKCHVAAAHTLIEHGANPNATSYNGATPRIVASQNRRDKLIQLFLEKRAQEDRSSSGVTAATFNEPTSLIAASENGRGELDSLLTENGTNKEPVNNTSECSLLLTCWNWISRCVNPPIEGDVYLNRRSIENITPIYIACSKANLDTPEPPTQQAMNKRHHKLGSSMTNSPNERLQSLRSDQGTSESSKNAASTPLSDPISSTSAEATNLECAVCLDLRTTTSMTLPCRHAKTCQNCMDDMEARGDNKCPVCRTEITQRIPIYL